MSIVSEGLKVGSAIIGGRAIKLSAGQKLVAEKGLLSLVENASQPVRGWVNCRVLIDDARRNKVSYQVAFHVDDRRIADTISWRRLCREETEVANWVEREIKNGFKKYA